MRYDLSTPLRSPLGQRLFEMQEQEDAEGKTVKVKKFVTMQDILAMMMFQELPDDSKHPNPKLKLERYKLGRKIVDAKDKILDINVTEAKLLKDVAGIILTVNIYGQVDAFLETPAPSPPDIPGVTLPATAKTSASASAA